MDGIVGCKWNFQIIFTRLKKNNSKESKLRKIAPALVIVMMMTIVVI